MTLKLLHQKGAAITYVIYHTCAFPAMTKCLLRQRSAAASELSPFFVPTHDQNAVNDIIS